MAYAVVLIKPSRVPAENLISRILRHAKGKWLLTYDDHPKIRELYRGFRIKAVTAPSAAEGVLKEPYIPNLRATSGTPANYQIEH